MSAPSSPRPLVRVSRVTTPNRFTSNSQLFGHQTPEKTEAARTTAAVEAIVIAGKASCDPPTVYSQTAREAAAEAVTAHGKSPRLADLTQGWPFA